MYQPEIGTSNRSWTLNRLNFAKVGIHDSCAAVEHLVFLRPDLFKVTVLYKWPMRDKVYSPSMPRCAFLTIQDRQGWFIDDDLVHAPLRDLGWDIEDVVWNQPADWNTFDLVVIRSPWDYQHHIDRFLSVLRQIEESSAILANSSQIVRWNVDKTYLIQLQNQGVEIVPTELRYRPTADWLLEIIEQFATDEIVVKPTVGATADDTFRLSKQTQRGMLEEVCIVFANKPCLVQPFMRSITDEGEFSLMFFDGELSHTILKTVRAGDFRVQEEHGGGVTAIPQPESILVDTANSILTHLPEVPLYARVDLVRNSENRFLLMELELIEPCLYFRFDSEAAQRFALAIDRRLGSQRQLHR